MRYLRSNNPEPEQLGLPFQSLAHEKYIVRMDGYDSKGRPLLGFPLPYGWSAWFNQKTRGMFFAVPSPHKNGDWQITESIYDYDKFIKELKHAVRLSQHDLGERLSRERIHGSLGVEKPFFFNRFLDKLSKNREDKERAFQHMMKDVEKEKLLEKAAMHEARERKIQQDYRKQYQSWEDNKTNATQLKKNPKRKPKARKTLKKKKVTKKK
jgi:hypothetical protein